MPQAFIIMQIGNPQLDRVFIEAIDPAVRACGLDPKRVDKHEEGKLLKSEIVRFIQESEIIVADLTNERPNVYLEIGYAMGLDKLSNLILMAREDHQPDHPAHTKGGPKIHFDLAGYHVLLWSPDRIQELRTELTKLIARRLAIVPSAAALATALWNEKWLEEQRNAANHGLADTQRSGYMEVRAALHPPKSDWTPNQLNSAAESAQLDTGEWPLFPFMSTDKSKPRPRSDGIFASVVAAGSYDYWAMRRTGDIYYCGTLPEDRHSPGNEMIYYNMRIARVAEALVYCLRFYSSLEVDRRARVTIGIRHGGLRGRELQSSDPNFRPLTRRISVEDTSDHEVSSSMDAIESALPQRVREIVSPLMQLFEFYELPDARYDQYISAVLNAHSR